MQMGTTVFMPKDELIRYATDGKVDEGELINLEKRRQLKAVLETRMITDAQQRSLVGESPLDLLPHGTLFRMPQERAYEKISKRCASTKVTCKSLAGSSNNLGPKPCYTLSQGIEGFADRAP